MSDITTPASIFDSLTDVSKGYDITPGHALDHTANISTNVTFDPVDGRIVHLNASGDFEMGAKADKIPYVLLMPSKLKGMPATYQGLPSIGWQAIGKYPRTALSCNGGYEISTNQYDTALTYNINNYLTGKVSNTVAATGGLLRNANDSDAALTPPWRGGGTAMTIVGQVTATPHTMKNGGISVLSFETVYFPGSASA